MNKGKSTKSDISGLQTRPLSADLWPVLTKLFGACGACGGCWCMYWRIEKDERWDAIKGPAAKRRMEKLVASGEAQGLIAFDGDEPVGWCTFGPRPGFPRLQRARTLACDDAAEVWSIPCFFIRRDYRGRGVAGRLLRDTLEFLQKRGVKIVEGYPVQTRETKPLPAPFAWTGVPALFRAAGFKVVGNPGGAKVRVRKVLRVGSG
jgi:GNAT superfamily N-acetyltransferase